MGGSSGASTKVEPWDESIDYAKGALESAQTAFDTTTSQQEYQGLSDEQIANVNTLQNFYADGGENQQYIDMNNAGMEKLTTATDDWTNNAALKAGMDANLIAANTQLTEGLLPSVRSGAAGAGQYGSSRQGVAEAVASNGVNNSMATANANLMNNYYNQAVEQEALGMSLIPQAQTIGASNITGSMAAQEAIDADARGYYEQEYYNNNQAQWDQLAKYEAAINPYTGIGGTTTTTGAETSTGAKVAGGVTAGLGAYTALAGTGYGLPLALLMGAGTMAAT